MKYIFALLIFIITLRIIPIIIKKNKIKKSQDANIEIEINGRQQESEIVNQYKPKWLFTYNEKDIYRKLNQFAQTNNLILLAKIRLFDLIEPIDKSNQYDRYRIQAKHVDFVLCTQSLIAKYIIELDDNSHNDKSRKERDLFLDNVLTACGYKVLHIRGYNETSLNELIGKKIQVEFIPES